MKNFEKFGIAVPEILLPKKIETETWAVVACDQYTQDREYWTQAEKICAEKNSTLNLILPEAYLNDANKSERIAKIKSTMKEYLRGGVFAEPQRQMVYVERTTSYGRTRKGLVVALDLDRYEWKPFSSALVRATEATILERIPPRMEIRRNAPLETPHIMLLANDARYILIETLGEKIKSRFETPIYSGNLMQQGGSIKGWAVKGEEDLDFVNAALEKLYGECTDEKGTFLFAVGDGNHSLATAKSVWEEHKKNLLQSGASEEEIAKSPVRYALLEIVNLYDEGLTFEPIHRAIFNADANAMIEFLQKNLGGEKKEFADAESLERCVKNSTANFGFAFLQNGEKKFVMLETQIKDLAVSHLQPALDEFLKSRNEASIDYIHGAQEIFALVEKKSAVGILLPPVAKESFFKTICERGPLPRKSFSMGEASEKRFYLECRKLFEE